MTKNKTRRLSECRRFGLQAACGFATSRLAAAPPFAVFVVVAIAALAIPARAANPPEGKVETVLAGLDNPVAVALRPGTNEVFVSESGAGRVVRITPGPKAKAEPVIVDFPVGPSPAFDSLLVGPLGLAFLNGNTLAVGGGGLWKDQKDQLGIFALPGGGTMSAGGKLLKAGDPKQKLGPIGPGPERPSGVGWYYSVLAAPDAIFTAAHGSDGDAWICRSFVLGGRAADIRALIHLKSKNHSGGPTVLTVSKHGELVVAQPGAAEKSADKSAVNAADKSAESQLSFYHPNGKLLMSLPTGLHDIVGLAYSPKTGLLYALQMSGADGKEGGLFRLDKSNEPDGRMGVKALKITALDKPTSLAFAADGTLYVTLLGTAKEKANPKDAPAPAAEKMGRLVKVTGGSWLQSL